MICFRGEQSWRLPSNKVKQFYFTAEDPGSPVIRVYDEAGNVIETHEHAGDFRNLLLFDNPACLDEERATQIGHVLLRKG
jgi:anti-sigma factor ChrR (cupin superfamily)